MERFPLLEWYYGFKSQAYNADIPSLNHSWDMFLAKMGRSKNKTEFENQNIKSFQK